MRRSVEGDIVVLATREPSAARDDALAAAVSAGPRWERVAQLAELHGVAPFVDAALRHAPWGSSVPPDARRRLRLLTAANAIGNAAGVSTLSSVLAVLASVHVEPIVLKGPALAASLYPSLPFRPFGDLDLLCRHEDLDVADAALRGHGFLRVENGPREQVGFHVLYEAPKGALPIEIHSNPFQLGVPERCLPTLWESAEEFTVDHARGLMLGLEHQLLHLCVHLHTHGYTRLIWFKDLDLLLRKRGGNVNWPVIHALARDEGVMISMRHALILLRELLDTPLPPQALAGLAGNRLGEVAHQVLWPPRRVLTLESKVRLRSVRFNPRLGVMGVMPSLLVMGRRREKLAYLLSRRWVAHPATTDDERSNVAELTQK